jgi:hypothetical protein
MLKEALFVIFGQFVPAGQNCGPVVAVAEGVAFVFVFVFGDRDRDRDRGGVGGGVGVGGGCCSGHVANEKRVGRKSSGEQR